MSTRTPHSGRARAVVFDLDGTLLDTLEDLADALNHVLVELGCPAHPVDAYRRFVGDGAPILVERALPEERVEELRVEALDRFRTRYADHMVVKTAPYAGIESLLDELTARNVPMAIVTNKPDAMAQRLSRELLGRWSFRYVCGQREDLPKKPDPTIPHLASRALDVSPEQCLFVGDSNVDIQTGDNAGMFAVGVSWGFRGAAELEAAGARAIIDEPSELLELLA